MLQVQIILESYIPYPASHIVQQYIRTKNKEQREAILAQSSSLKARVDFWDFAKAVKSDIASRPQFNYSPDYSSSLTYLDEMLWLTPVDGNLMYNEVKVGMGGKARRGPCNRQMHVQLFLGHVLLYGDLKVKAWPK